MWTKRNLCAICLVCACAILVFFAGCTTSSTNDLPDNVEMSPDYSSEFADFDAFVMETLDTYHVPGAYVGIVTADGILLSKGYGVRGVGSTELVDENTRFQLASVSKFVTATQLGTLVREGGADWDTPLQEYLPGFIMMDAYAGEHATLRDMLEHRSGLIPYDCSVLGRLNLTDAEILERVKYMKTGSSFRDRSQYSNVGFFIAGEVASTADGMSWEDSLNKRIYVPLGMTRSGGDYATLFLDENHVWGSMQDGDTVVSIATENAGMNGAGDVVSTGADMTRWMSMLLNEGTFEGNEIISSDVMHEILASNPAIGTGHGGPLHDPNGLTQMGSDSYYFGCDRVVEKNGALDGVRTIVTLVPEKDIGIVVLANKHLTVFPEAVRAEFLERVCGESGTDLQARILKSQAAWYSLADIPQPPASSTPASVLPDEITGTYGSSLYDRLVISSSGADNSEFTLSIGSVAYPGILRHWDNNTYQAVWNDPDDVPDLFTFTVEGDGSVSGIEGENMGLFEKVHMN